MRVWHVPRGEPPDEVAPVPGYCCAWVPGLPFDPGTQSRANDHLWTPRGSGSRVVKKAGPTDPGRGGAGSTIQYRWGLTLRPCQPHAAHEHGWGCPGGGRTLSTRSLLAGSHVAPCPVPWYCPRPCHVTPPGVGQSDGPTALLGHPTTMGTRHRTRPPPPITKSPRVRTHGVEPSTSSPPHGPAPRGARRGPKRAPARTPCSATPGAL